MSHTHIATESRCSAGRMVAGRGLSAVVLLLCGLLLSGCAVPQPTGEGSLRRIVEPTAKRGYWLYLPKDYVKSEETARSSRRWPLVVTFHGMKPFDNAYPQAREWEQEADRYGFIVVAPELRSFDVFGEFPLRRVHPTFQSDEMAVLAVLDQVFATTQADPKYVLATSWSSGGYMAHYMLNRHPDRFTALAVRQSNFSREVLDPAMTSRSAYSPILIVNTQNDFAICKEESRIAVEWYNKHGYKNVAWVYIKDLGHERTPDMAADFFGRVTDMPASRPPAVLVKRQAIDGNPRGLALLSGRTSFQAPPQTAVAAQPTVAAAPRSTPAPRPQATPPRATTAMRPASKPPVVSATSTPSRDAFVVQSVPAAKRSAPAAPPSAPVTAARSVDSRADDAFPVVLSIRVSSAIGIEPLHLGFAAECPPDWHETADFLWTLDGTPISNGVNGQKTLPDAGEHTLGLLVVTTDGQEHRSYRLIRVLPRLSASGYTSAQ